jgi:Domain of unknown function (DUF4388)
MSLNGRLKDLSIPQVLKLLSDGAKSGLLALRIFDDAAVMFNKHYLWLDQGAVVSLSDQMDGRDWLTWLGQQKDLGTIDQRQQLQRLNGQLDNDANLGAYLIRQDYLQPEQIQTLFEQRVVQAIGELFNKNNGFFTFNDRFTLPPTESLGLTIAVRDLNLQGLRQLSNWGIYQTELPESHVALLRFGSSAAIVGLTEWEQQLWQAADGRQSIAQLAKQWGCELVLLQQAAFSLIVSGLVEELSMATAGTITISRLTETSAMHDRQMGDHFPDQPALDQSTTRSMTAISVDAPIDRVTAPSNSFLNNLSHFFNKRLATSNKVEEPARF